MNERQYRLKLWIRQLYQGRKIRISGESYFRHLLAVANLAGPTAPVAYEIGLCHDLLEDLDLLPDALRKALLNFGYTKEEADLITSSVMELTDVYTRQAFPEFSKKKRKQKEAERLSAISPLAQTVKYADLIYNVRWTLQYEPEKAAKYLRKKRKQSKALDRGDPGLRKQLLKMLKKGLKLLN